MEKIKRTLRDSAKARWAILIIVSFLMAANYYFYDVLSPLKTILQEHLNFSSQDFGIVAGFYAFPNTFLLMAILGGIILDKMGIRPTGLLFAVFMLIGAALTAYGASDIYRDNGLGYSLMNSFWTSYSPELKMMSLGMLIFGLGAETSIVVASKILVKWFKGYEIALAFALQLGIARLGTALAFNLSPRLILDDFWTFPIWFAVMLLLIGFLVFLIYIMFDVKIDRQTKSNVSLIDKDEEFHISDLKKLFTNSSFLYIAALCVTFYAAVFPFLKYAPDFFYNKFGFSLQASGDIASLLPYGTVLFTPLFGWFVDKKGKSASLMIYGSLLLIFVHLMFGFTSFNAYVLMILLGIAFSLVPAAMWPSVAKIVPEHRIGTAYGAMFSLQNLGLFVVPILAGTILDGTNKFSSYFYTPIQTNEIIMNNYEFQSNYLDNDSMPRINKKLMATTYIFAIDDTVKWKNETGKILGNKIENKGQTIWSEYDSTKTNTQGVFDAFLGKGKILSLDVSYLNIYSERYIINIRTNVKGKPALNIFNGLLVYTPDSLDRIPLNYNVRNDIFSELDSKKFKIEVSITDTTKGQNILVYQESHKVNCKKKDAIKLYLGKGDVKFANISYIDWSRDSKNYFIKVRTPLNYTLTILMFALFGIIGLVFAFLLKHDDKTSGYGLGLPSNATVETKDEEIKI